MPEGDQHAHGRGVVVRPRAPRDRVVVGREQQHRSAPADLDEEVDPCPFDGPVGLAGHRGGSGPQHGLEHPQALPVGAPRQEPGGLEWARARESPVDVEREGVDRHSRLSAIQDAGGGHVEPAAHHAPELAAQGHEPSPRPRHRRAARVVAAATTSTETW